MTTDRKSAERIPAQRHARIISALQGRGVLSTADLAALVGASEVTIRRDLSQLAERHLVERTHGGAMLTGAQNFEPGFEIAQEVARAEKAAIGALAAGFVTHGASVIIDYGSTMLALCRALSETNLPLTAITNDILNAGVLAQKPSIDLFMPGGSLRRGTMSLVGELGMQFLSGIRADICFLSCHAVAQSSLFETSVPAASFKRAMLRAAKRRILLVDSSKFGHSAFCEIAGMSEIEDVVTDDKISASEAHAISSLGARLHIAPCG